MSNPEDKQFQVRLAVKELRGYRRSLLKRYQELVAAEQNPLTCNWHQTVNLKAECALLEQLLDLRK